MNIVHWSLVIDCGNELGMQKILRDKTTDFDSVARPALPGLLAASTEK